MEINVSSIVRSVAIGVVGLPVALGISGVLNTTSSYLNAQAESTLSENASVVNQNNVKADLTKDCLAYLLSKNDTKLERDSKDAVDEYFGGDVSHKEVCNWVID